MRRLAATWRGVGLRLRTIRVRLTLWYLALLMSIIAVFCGFLYLRLAQNLRIAGDQALRLEFQQIGNTLDLDRGGPYLTRALQKLPSGMVVVLYSGNGARLEASSPNPLGSVLPVPTLQGQRQQSTLTTLHTSVDDDWRVLTAPVLLRGQPVATLQVAQSQDQYESALHELALQMAVAIPLALLLAAVGGGFLASRALNPIDSITRTAQKISAHDLTQRLRVPASPDEVGRLAATFDAMLDRLERAFSQQRQFIADASHELRTPLAVLATQADLALDRARRPEDYRSALQEIRQQAMQMTRLLAELLALARADNGNVTIDREDIDLTALVADIAATLAPLAEAGGVRLSTVAIAPIAISGDQARLTQLVVDLVDNALKHTPDGGNVALDVAAVGDRVVLRVADSGVGIAAEHLPHVFERFYRVDAARSRDEGGAGLGLAICRWIVMAHQGDIAVESTPGAGTTVTVSLPRTTACATATAEQWA